MTSWAKVGVKCVCVDGHQAEDGWEPITEGATYTIWEVVVCMAYGDVGLLLDEVHNAGVDSFNTELGYRLSRFRPLVTKTQADDAALFAPLLAGRVGTKQGVDA